MSATFGPVAFKKGTTYKLNPADIRLPDSALQGRMNEPKNIEALAKDIEENGQIMPIVVRRDADGTPILVAGFRRLAAFLKINKKREKNGEEPFLIEAKSESISEEQAFLLNIRENNERESLSPLDMLKIANTLEKRFGKKPSEIAAILGRQEWIVYHLKQLATMSERIQKLCDAGKISLGVVAMTLAKVPVDERDAIIDQIIAEQQGQEQGMIEEAKAFEGQPLEIDPSAVKKITQQAIREAESKRRAAKKAAENPEEETGVGGPGVRRTLASAKKYFASVVESTKDENVKGVCELVNAFLDGDVTERAFLARMKKLFTAASEKSLTAAS